MGLGGSPISLWIAGLVLFPGGSERRERRSPGTTIGLRIDGRAGGATTRALPVGGVDLLNCRSIGAVDAYATGLV